MNGLILMDVASAQSCQGAGFVGMVCCCPAAAPRSGCIDFFVFCHCPGAEAARLHTSAPAGAFAYSPSRRGKGYTPPPLPGLFRIPRPAGAKVTHLRPAGAFSYSPSRRGKGYTPPPRRGICVSPVPPGLLRIPRPEGT